MVVAFAVAVAVGTALLMLPLSRAGDGSAPFVTALFTSTSAVCVTGLTVVDTATYWSVPGQVVLLALIQVGGFGIMTLASLIALLLSRRMGLRTRLTAAAETKSVGLGDVRRVLKGVLLITLTLEGTLTLVLTLRFRSQYDDSWGVAAWHGVFHAVSSFNNAGFALYSDNLMGFLTDGFILVPISVAIIIGGLGFPVLMELLRRTPRRRWSLHTRLTLLMTAVLLVGGTVFITISEWGNPGTLGPLGPLEKLVGGWFHAVQPRTAGFNAWDYGVATDETLLGTIILMFLGRLGPITLVSALALRERNRRYRYPEGAPLIG